MISLLQQYPVLKRLRLLLGDIRLSVLLWACVILGGTSQYIYTYKLPLYLISLGMIGIILSSSKRRAFSTLVTLPNILISGFIGVFIIYSIPMSSGLWGSLEGRHLSVEGFKFMGEVPWMPLSLHPERTFLSLFDFLPIIAIALITMLSRNQKELLWAVYSLLSLAFISVIFGIGQMTFNSEAYSLYKISNIGRPIGFFSNVNHFACLCAMLIPIAFYMAAPNKARRSVAKRFLGAILTITFVTGCVLSGSGAGYILLLAAVIVSPIIMFNTSKTFKLASLLMLAFIVILVTDFLFLSGEFSQIINKVTNDGALSRGTAYQTILSFRGEYGFFGIGPGAFEDVYKIHENESVIYSSYINQAHNDFLQIWLEFGVLGLLGILMGLFALMRLCYQQIVQRERYGMVYLLALSMPILHSAVDYPFRTIAISGVFIFLLSLLSRRFSF